MKKILFIITLLIGSISFAQAPQGINYQAVAYDANGFELSSQNIGVRISIIEGDVFGASNLVEVHSLITSNQGLFSLQIGQGEKVGGSAETLSDIPWGSNTYFLKIELDIENNGSYMDFGTQQFMSVPYALYAESSGAVGPEGPEGPEGPQGEQGIQGEPADPVNYDSLANMVSVDSTFLATVLAGIGGCNFNYPEGLSGEPIIWDFSESSSYIVPDGKSLYITNIFSDDSNNKFEVDGKIVRRGKTNTSSNFQDYNTSSIVNPILAGPGQIISQANTGGLTNGIFSGLLVNSDNTVKVTHCLLDYCYSAQYDQQSGSNYVVPGGKLLVILNFYSENASGEIYIDEINIASGYLNSLNSNKIHQPIFVNSGSIVSGNGISSQLSFNGYLVDEDYFANCGDGSSSNESSSADSIIVSTFGDTLTMNGQSIIVPGISFQNFPSNLLSSVTDVDGNVYQTVILDDQEWMTENLRVTHFSNGNDLNDNSGEYGQCYDEPGYKNNLNGEEFLYYNAIAVHDSRNICPTGWHVPTKTEFETLFDMFGYLSNNDWIESAIALKSNEPFAWQNSITSNASMLNFKPDGIIYCGTNQSYHTSQSWTWTSISDGGTSTWNVRMNDNSGNVSFSSNTNDYNLPVRCIKD